MADSNSNDFLNRISSDPEKLFFFSVLFGGISIIAGTFLGISSKEYNGTSFLILNLLSYLPFIINVIVPLGIIVIYASLIINDASEADPQTIEQKGDSVYYMGFIFTLFAMTISLVALSVSGDNIKFDSIVINFGLALLTTILGLLIRIIWIQKWSKDINDAETLMRDNIRRRSRELSDEIERVIQSIRSVSTEISNASEPLRINFNNLNNAFNVNENLNRKLEMLDKSAESAAISLKMIANLSENLSVSVIRLRDNVNSEVINDVDELTKAVNNAGPEVIKFDNELSNDVESIEASMKKLRDSIKRANEDVMDFNANLEKNNSIFKRIKKFFRN